MVNTGFRLVIGSWKIIASSLPRSARISRLGQRRAGRPCGRRAVTKRGLAADLRVARSCGSRRISVRLVTDLPEPDSPTSAVVLPGWIEKLTSATERDQAVFGGEARC